MARGPNVVMHFMKERGWVPRPGFDFFIPHTLMVTSNHRCVIYQL